MTTTRQELGNPAVAGTAPRDYKSVTVPAGAPSVLNRMLALEDFEEEARRYLPRPIFGYVSGGAETNAALRGNREVWDEIAFVPKTLVDVSSRSLKTTLFGHTYEAPFGLAPMESKMANSNSRQHAGATPPGSPRSVGSPRTSAGS